MARVHTSRLTRRRVAPLLALAVIAVTSQVSWADTADSPILVDAYNTTHPNLGIEGTTRADDVTVRASVNEFVVDAPGGIITSSCSVVSPTRVRCPHYSAIAVAELHGGDDTINFNGRHVHGRATGGHGSDTLLGNRRSNFFSDGPGNDEIRAGRGPDLIYAKPGRDSIFGQRGADTIYANDDQRDKVINCGPGRHDLAIIDRHLDPEPIGCEKVRFKDPPMRQLRRLGIGPGVLEGAAESGAVMPPR